jgi:hypothetical protein
MVEDKIIQTFIPLSDSKLTDEEIMDTYWVLRSAFEESHPNNMVDASDAYVLTVFPFKWDDVIPDNYKVKNYATGIADGKAALCMMDNKHEILILCKGRLVQV